MILTSEDALDSDVENRDATGHKVDEGVCYGVVLEPCRAVGLPVTELEIDHLEVDVEELIQAVAVHQTLFRRRGLVEHGLIHCDRCCGAIDLWRVVLELCLVVLGYQEQQEGSGHQD